MKSSKSPMYAVIMRELREKIKSGLYEDNKPLCTEKSLCEKYGVSRITAKRAIDELENEGLIYRKRGVGSFVRGSSSSSAQNNTLIPQIASKSIALMIPFDFTSGGIFAAVESASSILASHGVYLTLNVYAQGFENEEKMLMELYENGTDGVVYYPSYTSLPTEVLDLYCKDQKPVVVIDKPHDYPQYSCITCDNFNGSYIVTSHILAYGHKNTCYLSRNYCEDVSSVLHRYNGYVKAIEDAGFINPRFVKIDTPDDKPFDYHMLKHVINSLHNDGVTAIICENDEVAFYVNMCCRSLALKTSKDISIAGFDNIKWSMTGSAQITTVEQDFDQIGREIADAILQDNYKPIHKVVPVKLVPRTSTGPVPQKEQ